MNREDCRDIKRKLARKLVAIYHDENEAINAEREFDEIFVKKGLPDEIPEFVVDENQQKIEILELMILTKTAPSKGEARRLVTQGGVSLNGEKISDVKFVVDIKSGDILKVGKRNFIKLIFN